MRNRALGCTAPRPRSGSSLDLSSAGRWLMAVGWRAVFWVNVPMGITAALLGWRWLPADQQRRAHGSVDIVGAVLVTVATATLVYLPALGLTDGWRSVRFISGALLFSSLFAAFVLWERHQAHPLVRLGIFQLRTLRAANMITALFGAGTRAKYSSFALYLQRVLHYSPLKAGLASVPQGLAGLVAGLVGARAVDRFGIKGGVAGDYCGGSHRPRTAVGGRPVRQLPPNRHGPGRNRARQRRYCTSRHRGRQHPCRRRRTGTRRWTDQLLSSVSASSGVAIIGRRP